jgi:hypothetical protein
VSRRERMHRALDAVMDVQQFTPPMTSSKANKVLERAGYAERVAKGGGTWYFYGGQSHTWYSSSLECYRLDSFTPERLIKARNDLANDHRNF